ncbi:hypothetical protein ACIQPS_09015 [Streptomyces sp. NPDC091290]|uniref:hypothetical protein n=1 Tax=Streptomyces sp. NPDC091290 TaxID=3365990 RepID=UPI0038006CDE
MGMFSWLGGGNDRQLADTRYAGRESASDRAARKRRENHRRSITKTAAKAERWEQQDRRRFGGRR